MKKIEYKIIVSDKGFDDFAGKVSEKLNDGWKPIGGIAFNHGFPHQAVAKMIETSEQKGIEQNDLKTSSKPKALTANEAMRRIDELT